jgi:hypothetical protein
VRALLGLLVRLPGGVGLLRRQDPVDGARHERQALHRRRVGGQGRAVVEAVRRVRAEHVADGLDLLQQERHGLGLVDAGAGEQDSLSHGLGRRRPLRRALR